MSNITKLKLNIKKPNFRISTILECKTSGAFYS